MKLFEVFFQDGSFLVNADNERSARWKGATLLKALGFECRPHSLTALVVEFKDT